MAAIFHCSFLFSFWETNRSLEKYTVPRLRLRICIPTHQSRKRKTQEHGPPPTTHPSTQPPTFPSWRGDEFACGRAGKKEMIRKEDGHSMSRPHNRGSVKGRHSNRMQMRWPSAMLAISASRSQPFLTSSTEFVPSFGVSTVSRPCPTPHGDAPRRFIKARALTRS